MGPLDNRPDNLGAGDPKATEAALKAVTQELKHLQQDLILHLAQDFTRLVGEKYRLSEDIDKLRIQQQQLRVQQLDSISQRASAEQQALAQQVAEMVASQMQAKLMSRLDEIADGMRESRLLSEQNSAPRDRMGAGIYLASMDGTLMGNYEQVKQEIQRTQSVLGEQLNRLNGLQQQGEVIIERLVNRLIEQLQMDASAVDVAHLSQEDIQKLMSAVPASESGRLVHTPQTVQPVVQPQPVATPTPAPAKSGSMVQVGVLLALCSAVVLSLFNVCIKIIIKSKAPRTILGLFQLEGIVTPGFGNSLLILLFRTIVVLTILPILATFLYPNVWKDLKKFVTSKDTEQWLKVVGSGCFLFLSQVLIYIALGNIPTGIAITIFFVYPIVTVFASWALFGDKPTPLRYISIGVIIAGLTLATLPAFGQKAFGDVGLGVASALGSGVTFAVYILTAALGQKKLHPIPFTFVGFVTILCLCSVCLLLPLPKNLAVQIAPNVWPQLIAGGAVLGVLTLASYLLNNFAIRFAGPALASIIGASGPALTALFGFLIIKEMILPVQILGLLVVTSGVAAMSVEKLLAQKKPAASSAPVPSR
ncbi:MAG TPA: DMT family transporter [Halomicronema sp.]